MQIFQCFFFRNVIFSYKFPAKVQKPGILATFSHSDCNLLIWHNNNHLPLANNGQFTPACGGQKVRLLNINVRLFDIENIGEVNPLFANSNMQYLFGGGICVENL